MKHQIFFPPRHNFFLCTPQAMQHVLRNEQALSEPLTAVFGQVFWGVPPGQDYYAVHSIPIPSRTFVTEKDYIDHMVMIATQARKQIESMWPNSVIHYQGWRIDTSEFLVLYLLDDGTTTDPLVLVKATRRAQAAARFVRRDLNTKTEATLHNKLEVLLKEAEELATSLHEVGQLKAKPSAT